MGRIFSWFAVLCLFTLGLHQISAETHSLRFLHTALTPGTNHPEFTAAVLVDDEQVAHYDSNTRRLISKTEWIKKDEAGKHWSDLDDRMWGDADNLKTRLSTVMQQFSHTEGLHTMQRIYGCELYHDGTTRGFEQFGYDGADFISLDLKTKTWTAENDKALNTKKEWEAAGGAPHRKKYLENNCIEWLKKVVSYGKETLERKDPPEASLFQKLSSSPELVCHATGFFPKDIMMSWQKNREDVDENVKLLETLPNNDGSFQKRIILRVSPEELQKHDYTCVIQHSSMKEDLVLKASERRILSAPDGGSIEIINGVVVGVGVGLIALVLGVVGYCIWKKRLSAEQNSIPMKDLDKIKPGSSSGNGTVPAVDGVNSTAVCEDNEIQQAEQSDSDRPLLSSDPEVQAVDHVDDNEIQQAEQSDSDRPLLSSDPEVQAGDDVNGTAVDEAAEQTAFLQAGDPEESAVVIVSEPETDGCERPE